MGDTRFGFTWSGPAGGLTGEQQAAALGGTVYYQYSHFYNSSTDNAPYSASEVRWNPITPAWGGSEALILDAMSYGSDFLLGNEPESDHRVTPSDYCDYLFSFKGLADSH